MSSCKLLFEFRVYMKWERAERCFTSNEAVNVNDQKSPFRPSIVIGV